MKPGRKKKGAKQAARKKKPRIRGNGKCAVRGSGGRATIRTKTSGGAMQNMKMIGWLAMGAVAGVLMAWGGSTTGWTKPYDPAVMAYWVQAIGSIGAVCAAIAVSALQRKNDRIRDA